MNVNGQVALDDAPGVDFDGPAGTTHGAATNRRKGDKYERLTAELMRDKGYVVVRSAGSRSPADLWAMRVGELKFLQVKSGGKYLLDGFSPAEREALRLYATKAGAEAVLVRWYAGAREAHFSGPMDWRGNKRGQPDFLVDPESDCWIWQKCATANGYGRMTRDGRSLQAHRWYYEQVHGPIPKGLHLDHLCETPPCVNPDHLEPVTMTENLRRAGIRRLTEGERQIIRDSDASSREMAERFNVGPRHINRIRSGHR